jgi:hypothetical protein
MKHFDDKDLIDFARDTVSPEKKQEIQTHLDGGCQDCAKGLRLWTWMKDFAIREALNHPPASTVRLAKAVQVTPRKARRSMRELATLAFDSFAQLQVSGVRSISPGARQLLYRAGPLMIDMKLETRANYDRFSLVGQVLASDEGVRGVDEVQVHLLSGTAELASTTTNQFGEFYLEHDQGKDLQLSLEVSSEKEVFIPLDEVIWRVAPGRQS